ncbi:GNAT family N-acetyltransferase [Kitasatospora viridis]|uniref:Acetyltransferase (GNAT) family protein n=1 Tax=Kitasatospora viridis TaxID=281105 RepID=A0A561T7C7_9ACTN|nr:GNAT family N-acetyltransferase [Kitasatospora viridis]TWF83007.1 acetyltransferase (GNAT) family protein [Kitasatospora viridis]
MTEHQQQPSAEQSAPFETPTETSFETVELATYTPEDWRGIVGEEPDPVGIAHLELTWRPKEQHLGLRAGERLVAHAGWVEVPVELGGRVLRVAGLGGVAVAPDLRRRGLAGTVVTAAMAHARAAGLTHGLLFCWPRLFPLYGGLGWQQVAGGVRIEQPDGPIAMPMSAMWAPLADGAEWSEGEVRLRSLPF